MLLVREESFLLVWTSLKGLYIHVKTLILEILHVKLEIYQLKILSLFTVITFEILSQKIFRKTDESI